MSMRSVFVAFVLLLAWGAAAAAPAQGVAVRDAWIRATPPGAPTAAGYAVISNRAISSDRLMDGRTAVAAAVEVHQMSMAGGVMRMRPVQGGLALGASQTVRLSPKGDHLMLIGLKRPLVAGQHVRIVLRFRRAGDVPVDFTVRTGPPSLMAGMHM
jgi:copper(I)-binding protein